MTKEVSGVLANLLRRGTCPCGGKLLDGPLGGMSRNAKCEKCGCEFNIVPWPFSCEQFGETKHWPGYEAFYERIRQDEELYFQDLVKPKLTVWQQVGRMLGRALGIKYEDEEPELPPGPAREAFERLKNSETPIGAEIKVPKVGGISDADLINDIRRKLDPEPQIICYTLSDVAKAQQIVTDRLVKREQIAKDIETGPVVIKSICKGIPADPEGKYLRALTRFNNAKQEANEDMIKALIPLQNKFYSRKQQITDELTTKAGIIKVTYQAELRQLEMAVTVAKADINRDMLERQKEADKQFQNDMEILKQNDELMRAPIAEAYFQAIARAEVRLKKATGQRSDE